MIIPAHNEERYIKRTLKSIHSQTYPAEEIIVVANACSDHTAAVARSMSRVILYPVASKALAVNKGVKVARGTLIVILDADTTLSENALAVIARQFNTYCTAGTVRGRPSRKTLGYSLLYLMKNFLHAAHIHEGISGVLVCWKRDFSAVGGYRDIPVGLDHDLIIRLRKRGVYVYMGEADSCTSMRRYDKKGLGRMMFYWIKTGIFFSFAPSRLSYDVVR